MTKIVEVAVAAIVNAHNEVLTSLRPSDVHQGGLWEFPGGKIEIGETVEQALYREIKEELNIDIQLAHPLITLQHNYGDITVRLYVWAVTKFSAKTDMRLNYLGAEGQKVKWQSVLSLDAREFPAANKSIITALQLPNQYLITGAFESIAEFEKRLSVAIHNGITLLQLRLKQAWVDANLVLAKQVLHIALKLCEKNNVLLMLNIPEGLISEELRSSMGMELKKKRIGLHLDSFRLNEAEDDFVIQQKDYKYVSASCHNPADIEKAKKMGVDFIVLSPVKKTLSHPDAKPLGWQVFSDYVQDSDCPVYALGGVTADDIAEANQNGAQGIAGIGYGW